MVAATAPIERRARVLHGDCLAVLAGLDAESVDAVVTDPPYGLEFMGKEWDSFGRTKAYKARSDNGHGNTGILPHYGRGGTSEDREQFKRKANCAYHRWCEEWAAAVLRVLKPGGHLLAFGGTRTSHRMVCAIEDAGFEIRDCLMWLYGSGFPKSLDVSKAIDKHGGQQVAWFGPWFRKWREANGITQKQVAALFPSKSGGLTGCVANWELGFNMPTPDQFNAIRDAFGLPFDSIAAAEREVLATKRDSGGRVVRIMGRETETEYDITAPATDAARRWQGWGTALKPAYEPIVLARKPLVGTVAQNVQTYGTGAINVDGCRVAGQAPVTGRGSGSMLSRDKQALAGYRPAGNPYANEQNGVTTEPHTLGRWPANVILSYPEDEYELRDDLAETQRRQALRWLYENA